jgi:hypothetical protein
VLLDMPAKGAYTVSRKALGVFSFVMGILAVVSLVLVAARFGEIACRTIDGGLR